MPSWRTCNNRRHRAERSRRKDNLMRKLMPNLFAHISLRIIIDRFSESVAAGQAAAETLIRLGRTLDKVKAS